MVDLRNSNNYSLIILLLSIISITHTKVPKLTLILVIDQWAYFELEKCRDYFAGGIKFLLDNGALFENAVFPHALPETAVGHSSLSTGALPKDHGIVGNFWFDSSGRRIESDEDNSKAAAAFSKDGTYEYGRSSNNLMVDGLSDQWVLSSRPTKRRVSCALSHKSRAAIAMASKLGKAIWFDSQTGFFSSSKAYFAQMPAWLMAFNKKKRVDHKRSFYWPIAYPVDSPAYQFDFINDDLFIGSWGFEKKAPSIAGTTIAIDKSIETEGISDKGPYELFAKSPPGNKLLLECAMACVDEYLGKKKADQLLLWVSMSGLDKIGHPYGPDHFEALDILYHIDIQLKELITYCQNKVGKQEILFVLTADHGILPIPEIVQKKGYSHAVRISTDALVEKINKVIEVKYGVAPAIINHAVNGFYLNRAVFIGLDKKKRESIVRDVKNVMQNQDGIKSVWTYDELAHSNYFLAQGQLEAYFRYQLFKGRSADFICQVYPYCLMSDYPYGTSHSSPYEYDTHVPLILYQPGVVQKKRIADSVWMQQLPVTVAHLLGIPRPSAANFNLLPGV